MELKNATSEVNYRVFKIISMEGCERKTNQFWGVELVEGKYVPEELPPENIRRKGKNYN